MSQNRSTAVMQRRVEAHDSLDDFPTPPFATRAVCEELKRIGYPLDQQLCREPCADRGHMVAPLREYFHRVEASDVHDYGAGFPVQDYLWGPDPVKVDWTFMNPPFRLAQQFIERALRTSYIGVACIVRSAFTEGQERYDSLFRVNPPSYVFQHSERVCMLKGRLVRVGAIDPFAENPGTKAATATSYSWLVWTRPKLLTGNPWEDDTRFRWIAPCRLKLERDGDYPDYLRELAA